MVLVQLLYGFDIYTRRITARNYVGFSFETLIARDNVPTTYLITSEWYIDNTGMWHRI